MTLNQINQLTAKNTWNIQNFGITECQLHSGRTVMNANTYYSVAYCIQRVLLKSHNLHHLKLVFTALINKVSILIQLAITAIATSGAT